MIRAFVVYLIVAIAPDANYKAALASGRDDDVRFLRALEMVESEGNPKAVGDLKLKHKAYGPYQIRKPYLDDVNKFRRLRGLPPFTSRDRLDRIKAAVMVITYTDGYARQAGIKPTPQVRARIHSGGPDGWRQRCTLRHWSKVKKYL